MFENNNHQKSLADRIDEANLSKKNKKNTSNNNASDDVRMLEKDHPRNIKKEERER